MMAARNEDWVIGLSLRVALMWADAAVVLLHACEDGTEEIVRQIERENPGRVRVIVDADPEWSEMRHRQRMLDEARAWKATHPAIVDADEVLAGDMLPLVRDTIAELPPGTYLSAGMPCMWRGIHQYRIDGRLWAGRMDLTLAFHDAPGLGYRTGADGYDHHARPPYGGRRYMAGFGFPGGVMHLQWVSWRRLLAKHARYKAMERVKYPSKPPAQIDQLYSLATQEQGLRLALAPSSWWEPYGHLMHHMDPEREPWHAREVKRLVAEHGAAYFRGLNLLGFDQ